MQGKNGRYRVINAPEIYLEICLDGDSNRLALFHHIPDPLTYLRLFHVLPEHDPRINIVPRIDARDIGVPISQGAALVRSQEKDEVWLVTNGRRHEIKSDDVLSLYFDTRAVVDVPEILLESLPKGTALSP
jgi:hypothetical protein